MRNDIYWFENQMERDAHDVTRDTYLYHAKQINEQIKPFIVNSVKKIRWTKGLGKDEYWLPCLHVRLSNEEEDKGGMPFYVMEADLVNPKDGVSFLVDMPIGHPIKITSLHFALFAEHLRNAIGQWVADRGRIAKEGIMV